MAKIGFVGLGHMGLPMASNLIRAGHTVTGFDLSPVVMEAFVDRGGIAGAVLQDAAYFQDVIITMLQNSQQVKQACLGPLGLFAVAQPNTLYINSSSSGVEMAREIHQFAEEHHIVAVDAPVSGGVKKAALGTLTFMVGGKEAAFQKCLPYLQCMGKRIIYAGKGGNGQAAKVCNNMMVGVIMVAVCECFILAEKLGLSREKLFEVLSHSSGKSWILENYPPLGGLVENAPANNEYKAEFAAALMLKDLLLSQECAEQSKLTTPMAQLATSIYQKFIDEGFGHLDFSGIIKALRPTQAIDSVE